MSDINLENTILALLFASEEPLAPKRIASLMDGVEVEQVHAAVDAIEGRLAEGFPAVRLERVAGGLQLVTNPQYAEYIARMYSGRRKQRLSRAAMEALAIIAYKQPITRVDVENLRGVACGGVITTLMERSLIKMVGKAKVLGSPFLYGTTAEFLEYLGLNSLRDLPSMEELEALLEREAAAETVPESPDEENRETQDAPTDDGEEAAPRPVASDAVEVEDGERAGQ